MNPNASNLRRRPHTCKPPTQCICSTSALTPDDYCPVHGGEFINRCAECGRFIRCAANNIELGEETK